MAPQGHKRVLTETMLRDLQSKSLPTGGKRIKALLVGAGRLLREIIGKERRIAMVDFRRRQDSDRWHWSKKCSDYPTEKDVIISHTKPEAGTLCEECQEKEPLEEGQ